MDDKRRLVREVNHDEIPEWIDDADYEVVPLDDPKFIEFQLKRGELKQDK